MPARNDKTRNDKAVTVEAVFLDYSQRKLAQLTERICACLDQLSDEQVWARGNRKENAIGNLVLHLEGNVRQWICFGVGGRDDVRDRDAEFAARAGLSVAGLKLQLERTVQEALGLLKNLPGEQLNGPARVQGYDLTVLEAIYHVVEHFSGHTGQILFATKLLTGADLGFYAHLRQAGEHSESTP